MKKDKYLQLRGTWISTESTLSSRQRTNRVNYLRIWFCRASQRTQFQTTSTSAWKMDALSIWKTIFLVSSSIPRVRVILCLMEHSEIPSEVRRKFQRINRSILTCFSQAECNTLSPLQIFCIGKGTQPTRTATSSQKAKSVLSLRLLDSQRAFQFSIASQPMKRS